MKKLYALALTSLIISGCVNSTSIYTLNDKNFELVKNDTKINIKFTNPSINYFTSSCVMNSFILEDDNIDFGHLFVESIKLNTNCDWKGSSSSYFLQNFKSNMKLEKLEEVEAFEFENYSFKILKINNDSYLNFISISKNNSEEFILDYRGLLYENMIHLFKQDYISKYKNEKRFLQKYYSSLARKNITNEYIESQEIER